MSVKAKGADVTYVVRQHKLGNAADLQTVCEELEVHACLDHPNIGRIYEWFEDTVHCEVSVVIEYLAGGSLEVQLHMRDLDEREAAAILKKLCSAVGHVHDLRIVHGAIRPSNIMFSNHSVGAEPKLTGFGVAARLANPNPRDCKMGTAKYAAPEMWRGGVAATPSMDMWAVGVTAFVLLSGKLPFRGRTMDELRSNIESATPDFASGRWKDHGNKDETSGEAAEFCRALLCPSPTARLSAMQAKAHPFVVQHIEACSRNTATASQLFTRNTPVASARPVAQAVDLASLHEKSVRKQLTRQRTRGALPALPEPSSLPAPVKASSFGGRRPGGNASSAAWKDSTGEQHVLSDLSWGEISQRRVRM